MESNSRYPFLDKLKQNKKKLVLFAFISLSVTLLNILPTLSWVQVSSTLQVKNVVFEEHISRLSEKYNLNKVFNMQSVLNIKSIEILYKTCMVKHRNSFRKNGHGTAAIQSLGVADYQEGLVVVSASGDDEGKLTEAMKECFKSTKEKASEEKHRILKLFSNLLKIRQELTLETAFSKESILSQSNYIEETLVLESIFENVNSDNYLTFTTLDFSVERYWGMYAILMVIFQLFLFNWFFTYALYFIYFKL